MKFILFCLWVLSFTATACGVKSDPIPPLTPVEFGKGKTTYKSDDETSGAPASLQKKTYMNRERKDDGDPEEESR